MTIHQLASLLEHLQLGFGDSLKSGTGFAEAVAAMREMPDQSLKELAKQLQKPNPSPSTGKRAGGAIAVDVPTLIEQIRNARNGTPSNAEGLDPSRLTAPQLKEILKAFQQPQAGTKAVLVARVRQLVPPVGTTDGPQQPITISGGDQLDLGAVEEGVRVYSDLRDNKRLSISDVRAGFERLRGCSKPVVEEISRRLKYTPHGSRTEILDRLLSNLEGIKVSQYKMDQILTGT